jgi:glycosyltransferase involved in cell wall biosynthesis
MSMANDLYIIIATAGRAELLGRTLESLIQCEKPDNYRKTIVVENGPAMGAEATVRKYADALNAEYMHVPESNKCHALNCAMSKIPAGLIYFTDDDVRYDEQVLVRYAQAAEGVNGGEYYGGSNQMDYEKTPPAWLVPALPTSARPLDLSQNTDPSKFDFLGFNWAAFAQDIQRLGGFNTLLGPGSSVGATGDETDMQHRLLAAGVAKVPVPDAVVWHHVPRIRSSLKFSLRKRYEWGITMGLATRKEPSYRMVASIFRLMLKYLLLLAWYAVRFNMRGAVKSLHKMVYLVGMLQGHFTSVPQDSAFVMINGRRITVD